MAITLDSIKNALAQIAPATIDDGNLVQAGVLILLYPKDGELCVLLNKRTDRVEHHKGEISFPGGAQDAEDAAILDTALREAHEEMGIEPESVDVICGLDQVSTRSGFAITPFVGAIASAKDFSASDIEVSEVLEVPLSTLLDPVNRQEDTRGQDNGLPRQMGGHGQNVDPTPGADSFRSEVGERWIFHHMKKSSSSSPVSLPSPSGRRRIP